MLLLCRACSLQSVHIVHQETPHNLHVALSGQSLAHAVIVMQVLNVVRIAELSSVLLVVWVGLRIGVWCELGLRIVRLRCNGLIWKPCLWLASRLDVMRWVVLIGMWIVWMGVRLVATSGSG